VSTVIFYPSATFFIFWKLITQSQNIRYKIKIYTLKNIKFFLLKRNPGNLIFSMLKVELRCPKVHTSIIVFAGTRKIPTQGTFFARRKPKLMHLPRHGEDPVVLTPSRGNSIAIGRLKHKLTRNFSVRAAPVYVVVACFLSSSKFLLVGQSAITQN